MLEPTKGLTLQKVTLDDFGGYEGVGNMKDVTDRKIFRIVVSGKYFTEKKKKKDLDQRIILNKLLEIHRNRSD